MYFSNLISYRNTDRFSCFDNCIDFQCILFRQGLSSRIEHIFLILGYGGDIAFRSILFGNIWWSRKGPRFVLVLGSITPLRWMAVAWWLLLEKWLWIRWVSCLAPLLSFRPLTFSCTGCLPCL